MSGNRFACPLIITLNHVGCIQNITTLSGLSSVSHVAASSCLACPLLSLLLWPMCLPRMALPTDLMGMHSPPTLTNGIDNVTCEDKDVSKVCVCLWIKYTKLPGQHLPKIITLQKMTISQIKQLLQNYKET